MGKPWPIRSIRPILPFRDRQGAAKSIETIIDGKDANK